MKKEILPAKRGTFLRKNGSKTLEFMINSKNLEDLLIINGVDFIHGTISKSHLTIKPDDYYMIINNNREDIELNYDQDISNHETIYNPYKHENSKKVNLKIEKFLDTCTIPDGYIDTLPKWYSFKFTYPDYNLIFLRGGLGISIQSHEYRNEFWEVIDGNPIIISGNRVYYHVEKGTKFKTEINAFHSIINPNKDDDKFVIIKERWSGKFDENDIIRVFNPNNYV